MSRWRLTLNTEACPPTFDKSHFRHHNLQPVNQEGRRQNKISRDVLFYIFLFYIMVKIVITILIPTIKCFNEDNNGS